MLVTAHFRIITHKEKLWIPEHPSRKNDPHYKYFHQARAKLEEEGKLVCWICGKTHKETEIDLHHTLVEYSLANGIDISKFEETYPEFKALIQGDTQKFLQFVEGESNLTPLCRLHHIGKLGIHRMTYPEWLPQKYWKKGQPLPGVAINQS